MDSSDLYTLAKKYKLDEICLKLLRNNNYTDEVVILSHWKNIIDSISLSENRNKLELIKAKVISMSKDFYDSCKALFEDVI